jgi:MFS transporter, PPP family, 3-phenylpropionic acid transporter
MTPPSLWPLKRHYLVMYGVFGTVSPYIPVYLRDVKGLAPEQLGTIFAFGQSGVLFMPALMTLLADRFRVVSPLLVGLFSLNVVAMLALTGASGFAACLAAVFFYQLANQPQIALGDGLFFTLQSDPRQPRAAYSAIRIWGTVGFIVGSALVFVASRFGGLAALPWVTAAIAFLGVLNARGLPRRLAPRPETARALPTLDAARLFLRPRVALFACGVGLIVTTNTAYYGFYPLYLTQITGFDARWVGWIANLGVGIEILYMLSFERLRGRFGLPGIILLGGACCLVRQGLLAFVPHPVSAVSLQAMHGLTVIGILITPAMYLNTLAGDGYRNSVQGLYAMIIVGGFAIAGSLVSGQLAAIGLLTLYRTGFVVCAVGLAMIAAALVAFDRRPGPVSPSPPGNSPSAPAE